jgi:hypothetical protein
MTGSVMRVVQRRQTDPVAPFLPSCVRWPLAGSSSAVIVFQAPGSVPRRRVHVPTYVLATLLDRLHAHTRYRLGYDAVLLVELTLSVPQSRPAPASNRERPGVDGLT